MWRRSVGVQKGPWHSQGERTHRRAGESCVDSKAVGLHGLVLTDKASLNGQPLRRRSTTLSFKTCAGIATSAACALVLMFRAVSETRHVAWLLFCWLIDLIDDWLLAVGDGASALLGLLLCRLVCCCLSVSGVTMAALCCECGVVMISHEE